MKKNCIYSIYIEIPRKEWDETDENYADDPLTKNQRSWNSYEKYKNELHENKVKYSKSINADYIQFGYDQDYSNFEKKMLSITDKISKYDIINFYKFDRAEHLLKTYDKILFLDYDVICNTEEDFFKEHDLNKIPIAKSLKSDLDVTMEMVLKQPNWGIRSPFGKRINTYFLCQEYDVICPSHKIIPAYNTAIMGFSKKTINELNYFNNFEDLIKTMEILKVDESIPENVRITFGRDNETVFGFRLYENELEVDELEMKWHYIVGHKDDMKKFNENYFCHMINKRFDYYF